jgi:hypothetical protein
VSGPVGLDAIGRTENWFHSDGKTIGAERIGANEADLGDICLDGQGRCCVIYQSEKGFFFACHEDSGWRQVMLVEGPGVTWSVMECDQAGVLHVVYVSRGLLRYLRSDLGGIRWTGVDKRSQEADLIGGYCGESPSMAVSGRNILVAHHQGFEVITFSHYNGNIWKDNTVIPGSYGHSSPALTVDRHGVIWMQMASPYNWTRMCRWLGDGWSDLQDGRHLESFAKVCSAERAMLRDSREFGVILADKSHGLYFDTIKVPVPTTEKGSQVMFLDLWEVGRLEGVEQIVEPMEKDQRNPILKHGESSRWDATQANFQGTIFKEGDRYRLWYVGLDKKPYFDFESACGYAESGDGVNWVKPDLGLYSYGGNKHNNICFPYGFHYSVLKMSEALEANPNRRYRMCFTSDSVLLAFSPDGIHWTLSEENPLWITEGGVRCNWCGGDNVTYIYDPIDADPERRFKAFPQVTVGGRERIIGLMVSADGIHFKPYGNNPVIGPDLGVEKQNHMIEVCWQRHGVFIGLYGCYLDNINVDARLAVSRDGVHWVRVKNNIPFLPTGLPGTWDAGMVFPSNYPIIDGEDVWIYYSGAEFNFASGEGHASVGRARVRLDGLAKMQLRVGQRHGGLTTVPFDMKDMDGARLVVNADSLVPGKRFLLVEVLDGATGEVLPGFGAELCAPLTKDGIALPVRWGEREGLSGIKVQRISLRFLFNATVGSPRLCSFGFI